MSIQESKALTGNIVAGRRGRDRRVVTSGPLVAPLPMADGALATELDERDLPPVQHKPVGEHGVRSGRSKQTKQT
ncbi:MAG: hypothetical protein R2867_11305 [Caldilineaceae bacterium]